MGEKKELEFQKLKICILTISSSRELSDDKSGDVLEERVLGFGHELFERKITKDNILEIAKTGVNLISSGWLTHSSPSLDIGLDFS